MHIAHTCLYIYSKSVGWDELVCHAGVIPERVGTAGVLHHAPVFHVPLYHTTRLHAGWLWTVGMGIWKETNITGIQSYTNQCRIVQQTLYGKACRIPNITARYTEI